jgi:hypothetical protein
MKWRIQPVVSQKKRKVFLIGKKLTWKGATSGMMTKGMGPNPMAKDL